MCSKIDQMVGKKCWVPKTGQTSGQKMRTGRIGWKKMMQFLRMVGKNRRGPKPTEM